MAHARPICSWPTPSLFSQRAVSADHEIKAPFVTMFQSDANTVRLLFERDDLISEDGFDAVLDLAKQQLRQIAAWERHVTSVGQFGEDSCSEASNAVPGIVDDPHLLRVV